MAKINTLFLNDELYKSKPSCDGKMSLSFLATTLMDTILLHQNNYASMII